MAMVLIVPYSLAKSVWFTILSLLNLIYWPKLYGSPRHFGTQSPGRGCKTVRSRHNTTTVKGFTLKHMYAALPQYVNKTPFRGQSNFRNILLTEHVNKCN